MRSAIAFGQGPAELIISASMAWSASCAASVMNSHEN
jgi:hypothetical protein